MHLDALTRTELIFPTLEGGSREAVLELLARRLASRGVVGDAHELFRRLIEREELGSTGIGSGIAIPHCKMKGIDQPLLAIGITRTGVDFGSTDAQPVRVFFLVVSPTDAPAAHLQALAAISRWVKTNNHVGRLLTLDDPEEILELLHDET